VVNLLVVAVTFVFCAVLAIAALRGIAWWERRGSRISSPSRTVQTETSYSEEPPDLVG
jgi:hypothetical protein